MVLLNSMLFLNMKFQSFQKVISACQCQHPLPAAKLTDVQQTISPLFWRAVSLHS